MTRYMRITGLLAATIVLVGPAVVAAQARSARDVVTAYGARLNAKGQPADLNQNRVNNRVNSRIDTRLSLRLERYRPDADPVSAFATPVTDNTRVGTTMAPMPQQDGDTVSPR